MKIVKTKRRIVRNSNLENCEECRKSEPLNYYRSPNIQYLLYSGCASSLYTSGEYDQTDAIYSR
jgi:hypothetical protein